MRIWILLGLLGTFFWAVAQSRSISISPSCGTHADQVALGRCFRPFLDAWELLRQHESGSAHIVFPTLFYTRFEILTLCDFYLEAVDNCLSADVYRSCKNSTLLNFVESQVGFICTSPHAIKFLSLFDCVSAAFRSAPSCRDHIRGLPLPELQAGKCQNMRGFFTCMLRPIYDRCSTDGLVTLVRAIQGFGCDIDQLEPDFDDLHITAIQKAATKAAIAKSTTAPPRTVTEEPLQTQTVETEVPKLDRNQLAEKSKADKIEAEFVDDAPKSQVPFESETKVPTKSSIDEVDVQLADKVDSSSKVEVDDEAQDELLPVPSTIKITATTARTSFKPRDEAVVEGSGEEPEQDESVVTTRAPVVRTTMLFGMEITASPKTTGQAQVKSSTAKEEKIVEEVEAKAVTQQTVRSSTTIALEKATHLKSGATQAPVTSSAVKVDENQAESAEKIAKESEVAIKVINEPEIRELLIEGSGDEPTEPVVETVTTAKVVEKQKQESASASEEKSESASKEKDSDSAESVLEVDSSQSSEQDIEQSSESAEGSGASESAESSESSQKSSESAEEESAESSESSQQGSESAEEESAESSESSQQSSESSEEEVAEQAEVSPAVTEAKKVEPLEDVKPDQKLPQIAFKLSAKSETVQARQCSPAQEAHIFKCLTPLSNRWLEIRAKQPDLNLYKFSLFRHETGDLEDLCNIAEATLEDCLVGNIIEDCSENIFIEFVARQLGFACGGQRSEFFQAFDCLLRVHKGHGDRCMVHLKGPQYVPGMPREEQCSGVPEYFSCMEDEITKDCEISSLEMFLDSVQNFGCDIRDVAVKTEIPEDPVAVPVVEEEQVLVPVELTELEVETPEEPSPVVSAGSEV